jgi:hypothetical protein
VCLLKVLRMRASRIQLVGTLSALADHLDPSLLEIMPLVADMNSFSKEDIEGLDYEKRLGAYRQANEPRYLALAPEQATVLLQQTLFELSSADMAMRHASSASLNAFLAAAAKALAAQEDPADKTGLPGLVRTLLLPQVTNLRTGQNLSNPMYVLGYFWSVP